MADFDDRASGLSADRRELLELWLSREEAAGSAPYVAPSTPPERALADIWADVLEVERVGVDDDYFVLGGDSILAIVVIARAGQAGLALSTQDLFDTPTIRQLAQRASLGVPAGPAPDAAPPFSERTEYPLTPLQEGMLFHTVADPDGSAYLVQVICRLEGEVDVADLTRAWQLMAERSPVLRLGFLRRDGGMRQVVHPHVTIPVEVIALTGPDRTEHGAQLTRYLAADRHRGFTLEQPPLLRVALLGPATGYWCVITHHHLLLDGWSQQLLLAELLEVYDGLATGTVPAQRPRLQFGAYLDWLADQDLAAAQRFFQAMLCGFRPIMVDQAGRGCPAGGYAELDRTVSAATSRELTSFGRRHRMTLGTLVQGGWALLLAGLTGSDDVAFGVTVSGRPAELEGSTEAIGMFINTLPVRARVNRADEPVAWLSALQRTGAQLQRHFPAPLTLVERCRDDRAVGRLFDTLVVIENFPTTLGEGYAGRRLRVAEAATVVEEGYPLVLEVRPGPPVRLRLRYHTAIVSAEVAAGLLDGLAAYLDLVPAAVPGRIGDLVDRLAAAVARAVGTADDDRRVVEARRLLTARRQRCVAERGGEPDD